MRKKDQTPVDMEVQDSAGETNSPDAEVTEVGNLPANNNDSPNSKNRNIPAIILALAISVSSLPAMAQSTTSTNSSANVTSGAGTLPIAEREDQYWKTQYSYRPYYDKNIDYSNYSPAYRYGASAYTRFNGAEINTISDAELRRGWEMDHGNSTLTWDQARGPFRDAYTRLYNNRTAVTGSNAGLSAGVGSNAATNIATGTPAAGSTNATTDTSISAGVTNDDNRSVDMGTSARDNIRDVSNSANRQGSISNQAAARDASRRVSPSAGGAANSGVTVTGNPASPVNGSAIGSGASGGASGGASAGGR